jgi:hypothetical protein
MQQYQAPYSLRTALFKVNTARISNPTISLEEFDKFFKDKYAPWNRR